MISNVSCHEGVAAFFDLDGTLIPEPVLERRFWAGLRQNGSIPFINYLRFGVEALRLLPQGISALRHANKRYLAGVRTETPYQYLEPIVFYEEALQRVVWHARQDHEIVLVSGTLEPLARLAAVALECELEARGVEIHPLVCATCLEERSGRWTGRVLGEAAFGAAKQRAIAEVAKSRALNLHQCYVYGNSLLDRQMLAAVGHAHAVNPGRELAAIANQQNWPILHWSREKRVRTAATTNHGGKNRGGSRVSHDEPENSAGR